MEPIVVRGAVIAEDELSWRFSRASGPGGQSVNTTDSRVELSFDLAGSTSLPPALRKRALSQLAARFPAGLITVSASRERSQLRNREAARRALAALLVAAGAPPARHRVPTRPSRGQREQRLADKRRRSQTKAMRAAPPD